MTHQHDEWRFAGGEIRNLYHDVARTGSEKLSFVIYVDGNRPKWCPEQVRVELWLTERAWPHVKPKLRGLGFTGDLEDAAVMADDSKRYRGCEVRLALREKDGGQGVDARLCKPRGDR